jgi:hypothetical protein
MGCCRRYAKSVGSLLTPPLGDARALGPLQPTAVTVEGASWRDSSMDIAVAGERCILLPSARPAYLVFAMQQFFIGRGDWVSSQGVHGAAGVGWVGVGVSGSADFRVWAPEGGSSLTRMAVILQWSYWLIPVPCMPLRRPCACRRCHHNQDGGAAGPGQRPGAAGLWQQGPEAGCCKAGSQEELTWHASL